MDIPLVLDAVMTQKSPQPQAQPTTAEQTRADVSTALPSQQLGTPEGTLTPLLVQPKAAPKTQPKPIPISPTRAAYASAGVTSPSLLRSASPRLDSPASSEIFERSVQEPVPMSTLEGEPKAHLPTHVITEDFIPPALEASVQAITSQELNPDEVEIVTSATHQTAAASVMEGSSSHLDLTSLNSSRAADDLESVSQSGLLPPNEEETSTYGSIDPNDVRRLSFISFADVVQSEHQHPTPVVGETASQTGSLPTSAPIQARSRSPFRSPSASQTGGLTHITSAEQSPSRHLTQPGTHGELTIETMRQAVRKTASGDIGQNFRSPATSPVLSSDPSSASRSRTNT